MCQVPSDSLVSACRYADLQPCREDCKWYGSSVMAVSTEVRKPLRMVTCGGCGAKVFIPGELAPLSTVPCTTCNYPLMMPLRLRQFELLMPIASGGMGTVYRAFDTTLQR